MTQLVRDHIEALGEVICHAGWQRPLVVVDEVAFQQSGAAARIKPDLARFRAEFFRDFDPNPRLAAVEQGVKRLRDGEHDAVIAIGGGTAIDIAKLICWLSAQEIEPSDLEVSRHLSSGQPSRTRQHPLVAIPTTAGTGSEATQFAVVYINDRKYSVSDESLLPDVAIVDPRLTHSLPPRVTMASGLDVLAQSIESMWSVRSTESSIDLAERALRLGLSNLESAVLAPRPNARANMMRAAHLAGQAINVSRTTAPHALSYSMTIRHSVPHGCAVALSMAPFLRFNSRVDAASLADRRGIEHVRRVFDRIAAVFEVDSSPHGRLDRVAASWQQLLTKLGCGSHLRAWGIVSAAERQEIGRAVNQQRLSNNPRVVTEQDVWQIVEQMAGESL